MDRRVSLHIECGELRCYSPEHARLCRHVLTTHFGSRWVCGIFRNAESEPMPLKEESGWLMRCDKCREAE